MTRPTNQVVRKTPLIGDKPSDSPTFVKSQPTIEEVIEPGMENQVYNDSELKPIFTSSPKFYNGIGSRDHSAKAGNTK